MNSKPDGWIFSRREWDELRSYFKFSPRQAQIVQGLFSCMSDKQIARELNISVSTVRMHLTHLFMKNQVADRNELVLHIFSHFRQTCRSLGCPRK